MQPSDEQEQSISAAEEADRNRDKRVSDTGKQNQSGRLAKMLLALNPRAAYNAAAHTAGPAAGRSRNTLGRRASVMRPDVNDFAPSESGLWVPKMQLGAEGRQMVDGVPIGPPPDLPSLLLNNRIVYVGMQLAPSVAELIVAELLFLNYDDPVKDVYMYLNSVGTAGGLETDSFAIVDTMNYIQPKIATICVGSAFGTAAMLLANGEKGKRACLPNAQIMLSQPSSQARGQASDIAIAAREVLSTRKAVLEILSEKTGQPVEKLMKDSMRTNYLTAEEALDYGIIDKVLKSEADLPAPVK